MRLLLILAGLVAGLMAFAAYDRAVEESGWLWGLRAGDGPDWWCETSGTCAAVDRADRAQARRLVLQTSQPDFLLSHYPDPTPARQASARAVSRCTPERFDASMKVRARTREGRRWVAGYADTPSDRLAALAEDGDAGAQFDLAAGHLLRAAARHDRSAPTPWLEAAARSGDADAMRLLSLELSTPPATNAQLEEARRWSLAAAEAGSPAALVDYAQLFLDTEDGAEALQARRLDLLLEAAQACYEPAAILIAERLADGGRGLDRDLALADSILHRVTQREVFAPAPAPS